MTGGSGCAPSGFGASGSSRILGFGVVTGVVAVPEATGGRKGTGVVPRLTPCCGEALAGLIAGVPVAEVFWVGATVVPVVGKVFCAGTPVVPVVVADPGLVAPGTADGGAFGSTAGLSGTDGNRCARMSAARMRTLSSATGCRSCFS